MLRLGMLDFDTSHVVEFTKRLNHKGITEDQWVEGARVVVACPGESRIMPERIPGYTRAMQELGVPLVDKPTDMIGKIDGIMVESQQGSVHLERARPFLEAGIPCWIDKPFTCSTADAQRIVELAARKNVSVFSSSSLRYAPEVVNLITSLKQGKTLGALTYGPASLHDGNPGLFHYGIHAVEMLYTLMGPGCLRLTCTHEQGADVTTGQWKDGRLATVRGLRSGKTPFGFVAFTDQGVHAVSVGTSFIYRELLKKIVEFFSTRKAPVDITVTVEIVAFIEAAWKSAQNHGTGEKLPV
ncbi:MAG: Gfo/Idh/MocA family oxidoreductase [Gemmataceae bacterium]|nr:Gfo/Idh/MocA family oxidoreductase [Gemmataceae bacterium]MDW8265522.1 Gfo/Idh/MocA family oxidoreductase [Gemmataceae bacterium]